MSPTLAALGSRLHTTITIGFLALWIIAALGFAALDVVDPDWNLLDPIMSMSLLTYLICRLIAACQKNARDSSMAYRVTSAHRRSRREAFAMLLFSCAWIYELLFKLLLMLFVTILGSAMFVVALYSDSYEEIQANSPNEYDIDLPTALAKVDEFKEEMGFDPVAWFGWIPPRVLIYCAILAWVTFGTLSLYVLRLGWKSIKVVFGPSSSVPAPAKLYVV